MSLDEYKDRYLALIHQFLGREITGAEFDEGYSKLWIQDRDETYAKRESWPERFDLQLEAAFERGEINSEEFSKRWAELWEYANELPFVEMRDNVFTACYSLVEDPSIRDPRYEYDEDQLRAYVKATLWAYEVRKSTR